MSRIYRSRVSRYLAALAAVGVVGVFMFGSFGEKGEQLGVGQRRVTAQPTSSLQGQTGTMTPGFTGGTRTESATYTPPSAEKIAEREAVTKRLGETMAARANRLPASDPRVTPDTNFQAPGPFNGRQVSMQQPGASAAPQVPGTMVAFQNAVLNPASAGLSSSVTNEPAVAQNGRYVFQTWNWGAARSITGGNTFTYIDPDTFFPGMADFCCDQDVIYDKGRDRFFWLRMGIGLFANPLGGSENRHIINVDTGAGATCFYDIRASLTGNGFFADSFIDYPRMAVSNDFLYVQQNVFNAAGTAFKTHLMFRFALDQMATCAGTPFVWWNMPEVGATGWTPALVENARETMYLGDTLIASGGLNNGFRVYWQSDDSTVLNFVDRVIANYTFTNRDAVCTVPGGFNPCLRADIRVTGGAIFHNSPLPTGLGASGDRVSFFWNVKAGNGFPLPYIENATFHAGTLAYGARNHLAYSNLTPWYGAAGANDRDHVGLAFMGFWPVATGINPQVMFGVDDDFNGVPTGPGGWEIYSFGGTFPWTANSSGDYLRSRKHSPVGTAWIMSNFARSSATQYMPSYIVYGRERDTAGVTRFFQQ